MSELAYTPNTETVRAVYAHALSSGRLSLEDELAVRKERFDRWLAEHDREVRERTLAPFRTAISKFDRDIERGSGG